MPSRQEKVKDVSAMAFWAALAVSVSGTFLTSGISVALINQIIDGAGGGEAGASDVFTIVDVFIRAFPLVIATIITIAVLMSNSISNAWAKFGGVVFVWFLASAAIGGASPHLVSDELLHNFENTGPPRTRLVAAGVDIFAHSFASIFTAYGIVLTVQGIIVGVAAVISYVKLKEKWSLPTPPPPAAPVVP